MAYRGGSTGRGPSATVVVGALVAFVMFGLAAVLLVSPGPESTTRLGLVFGLIGTIVPVLLVLLRADQSAKQTNGTLDDRIEAAVYRAQNVRRRQVEREAPAADDLEPNGGT